MSEKTIDQELAELEAAEQKALEESRTKSKQRQIEILKLVAKYRGELGPRGEAFEVVNFIETPVVLKLGEAVLFKRFMKAKRDANDMPPEDAKDQFVKPCIVYPDAKVLNDLFMKRGEAVINTLANVLVGLYQGRKEADEGK